VISSHAAQGLSQIILVVASCTTIWDFSAMRSQAKSCVAFTPFQINKILVQVHDLQDASMYVHGGVYHFVKR
jgi:hypothetical protein